MSALSFLMLVLHGVQFLAAFLSATKNPEVPCLIWSAPYSSNCTINICTSHTVHPVILLHPSHMPKPPQSASCQHIINAFEYHSILLSPSFTILIPPGLPFTDAPLIHLTAIPVCLSLDLFYASYVFLGDFSKLLTNYIWHYTPSLLDEKLITIFPPAYLS